MKVLVLAAHPDDEILGVGGTLAKHVHSGDQVYVCIVTKAYEPQWSKEYQETKVKEQKKVDQLLGVTQRYNLDLPTVRLGDIPYGEFNAKITAVVDEVKPDIIYTHYENDLNYDHTRVYKATLVATRPPKRIRILCYETVSESEWGLRPIVPNIWNDITDFIDKKIKAFQIYKSEVKEDPHPRSPEGLRFIAGKRGHEICVPFAEAFTLKRDIWE